MSRNEDRASCFGPAEHDREAPLGGKRPPASSGGWRAAIAPAVQLCTSPGFVRAVRRQTRAKTGRLPGLTGMSARAWQCRGCGAWEPGQTNGSFAGASARAVPNAGAKSRMPGRPPTPPGATPRPRLPPFRCERCRPSVVGASKRDQGRTPAPGCALFNPDDRSPSVLDMNPTPKA